MTVMPSSQGLSFTHERAGTPQVERCLSRTGSKRTRTHCCCSRQRNSTSSRTKTRDMLSRLALKLGDTTANSVLPLSLAALLVLQQPTPALADSSASTPPPSTATSSSTASQAASRTVIDVVSGENTVLSEQNTPDNRQGPDRQQQDNKNNIPVGDTSEAASRHVPSQQQVYLDVTVDGEPKGRLVIQLSGDSPVGAKRFTQLSQGLNGVGYRLSKFDGIAQGFIKNSGQRSLTYDATNISKVAGGDTVEELEAEMAESSHRHDSSGTVSLIVKDTRTKLGKTKLVAYNGKLIRVEEPTPGESPNGSGFVITTQPAPDLDATNLVIGHVVEGMDLVQELTKLPTVKSNNSVFFRAAKTFGDKRADVAEKGFGRPFQKVLVSASGVLESEQPQTD